MPPLQISSFQSLPQAAPPARAGFRGLCHEPFKSNPANPATGTESMCWSRDHVPQLMMRGHYYIKRVMARFDIPQPQVQHFCVLSKRRSSGLPGASRLSSHHILRK
ncbi:hypothetical protein VTH06DRAFT_6378 [Thermothelomyces fergusii]